MKEPLKADYFWAGLFMVGTVNFMFRSRFASRSGRRVCAETCPAKTSRLPRRAAGTTAPSRNIIG